MPLLAKFYGRKTKLRALIFIRYKKKYDQIKYTIKKLTIKNKLHIPNIFFLEYNTGFNHTSYR